jgi:hypothetical protein
MEICDAQFVNAMMSEDSCFWAIKNEIRLMGGTTFGIEDCGYLVDIMRDKARRKAIQKAAQARITTAFVLDSTHGMIYGKYPQGVIYYFPTEKAVESFSKTRFGPLIADNVCIRRHMKNTNSVSVKRVGETFLRLLGASSTKNIQGKKDGTSVRSEPADVVIRDERDLFDDDMAEQTKQRILNSKIGKEVDLGTPTIPDYGISKAFNESDQRHWMVKCNGCNEYTCIVDEFPNSIKYRDGRAFTACIHCDREISARDGEWVAKYPDRVIAGWLVSHFVNPNIRLDDIMLRFQQSQRDGKIGEFTNSILGRPYIAAEDRLRIDDVMACCCNDGPESLSLKGTAMGADIGKTNHVVIAQKIDKKRGKIIYMARVKGFRTLHDLAKKFNVKSAVIDLRPYEESFRKFQQEEPYKVFGCEYRDRMRQFSKRDDQEGVYVIARTEMFDKTHAWVKDKGLIIPRKSAEVDEFAKQMCNCAKVLEENEQGDRIYRYRKLGDDHYRNAVNYLYLALLNLHDYDVRPPDQLVTTGNKSGYDVLHWGL